MEIFSGLQVTKCRDLCKIYIYILVYKYCNSLRANGLELKNMVVS